MRRRACSRRRFTTRCCADAGSSTPWRRRARRRGRSAATPGRRTSATAIRTGPSSDRGSDAQRPAPPPGDEFAGVTSAPALLIALETLAVQSQFQNAEAQTQRDKIRYLADHFAEKWGDIGNVAEAFGRACIAPATSTGACRGTSAPSARTTAPPLKVAEQWATSVRGRRSAAVTKPEPSARQGEAGRARRRAQGDRVGDRGPPAARGARAVDGAREPVRVCVQAPGVARGGREAAAAGDTGDQEDAGALQARRGAWHARTTSISFIRR